MKILLVFILCSYLQLQKDHVVFTLIIVFKNLHKSGVKVRSIIKGNEMNMVLL